MAISINDVYQTTLTLLNKEQRGYVTMDEFNHVAGIVQNEVFEGYFQKAAAPVDMDSELANIGQQYQEKLMPFVTTTTFTNNNFSDKETFYGAITESNFYRLLDMYVTFNPTPTKPAQRKVRCDRMHEIEETQLFLSPLTAPTSSNPVLVFEGQGTDPNRTDPLNETIYPLYRISPEPLTVSIQYIRTPNTPNWIGATLNGQIVPSPLVEGYQDFELHASDYSEVVAKVLLYFGLNVRDQEVEQIAAQQEQKNNAI